VLLLEVLAPAAPPLPDDLWVSSCTALDAASATGCSDEGVMGLPVYPEAAADEL